jgi:hypothetical protein
MELQIFDEYVYIKYCDDKYGHLDSLSNVYRSKILESSILLDYNVSLKNFCAMIQWCIEHDKWETILNVDKTILVEFFFDNIIVHSFGVILTPVTQIIEIVSNNEPLAKENKELKDYIKSTPAIIGTFENKLIIYYGNFLHLTCKVLEFQPIVKRDLSVLWISILPSMQYANCVTISYENSKFSEAVYKYMPKNVETIFLRGKICYDDFIKFHNPDNIKNVKKIIVYVNNGLIDLTDMNKFNIAELELIGSCKVDSTMLMQSIKTSQRLEPSGYRIDI